MKAIALLNLADESVGFMLLASTQDNYVANPGNWKNDCVFICAPQSQTLFNAPAYLALSEHRVQDEHKVNILNDGKTINIEAFSVNGDVLYVSNSFNGMQLWGIREGELRTDLGRVKFL